VLAGALLDQGTIGAPTPSLSAARTCVSLRRGSSAIKRRVMFPGDAPRLAVVTTGRHLAYRQWILIPPFGGSIPPAPATQSYVWPGIPKDARMGRKSRLFPHSVLSPGSQLANLGAPNAESLRLRPRIFPFCGDCRRRLSAITTAARRRHLNLACSRRSPGSGRELWARTAVRDWQSLNLLGGLLGEACNVYRAKLAWVIVEE